MEPKEIAVILFADLVSGKDDHILGIISFNERNILVDRVGGSLVPVRAGGLLIRRQHMDTSIKTVQIPGLPIADVFI